MTFCCESLWSVSAYLADPWQWPTLPLLSLRQGFPVTLLRYPLLCFSSGHWPWVLCLSPTPHGVVTLYFLATCPLGVFLPSIKSAVGPAVSKNTPLGSSCFGRLAVAHSTGLWAEPKDRRGWPSLPNLAGPYFQYIFLIPFGLSFL